MGGRYEIAIRTTVDMWGPARLPAAPWRFLEVIRRTPTTGGRPQQHSRKTHEPTVMSLADAPPRPHDNYWDVPKP